MDSAFQYIRDRGVANENDYPYTARDGKCASVARNFRLSGFTDIGGGDCQGLANAAQQRAVAVAVDASNWGRYGGGTFSDCAKGLNHGVVLVGVRDDGSWRIRNSWSANWGEGGHITLAGGDTCGVCQAASFPNL